MSDCWIADWIPPTEPFFCQGLLSALSPPLDYCPLFLPSRAAALSGMARLEMPNSATATLHPCCCFDDFVSTLINALLGPADWRSEEVYASVDSTGLALVSCSSFSNHWQIVLYIIRRHHCKQIPLYVLTLNVTSTYIDTAAGDGSSCFSYPAWSWLEIECHSDLLE